VATQCTQAKTRFNLVNLDVVADPDVESIRQLIESCSTVGAITREEMTFLHDLVLLEEYLKGVEKEVDMLSRYSLKFLGMLTEVLPRK